MAVRACVFAGVGTVAAGSASLFAVTNLRPILPDLPLRDVISLVIVVVLGLVFARGIRGGPLIGLGRPWPAVAAGVAAGLGPVALAWALLALVGAVAPSTATETSALVLAVVALPLLCLHGLAEQWLIQRVAQDTCEQWRGPWAGLAAAGLVLAGIQAAQGYAHPVEVVNSCLLGVLFALIARGPAGLAGAAIAHGLWSWTASAGVMELIGHQVLPGLAGGTQFDPYGSPLFGLVLLVIVAAIVVRWPPQPGAGAGRFTAGEAEAS
jgi:hypothetical protein